MGRRIRWLGVVLVLCFALVIVQLINIQFRQASALANSPDNPRVAATRFDNERGTIMASDGTVLAKSVKINSSSSTYNYQRDYPDGPLYAGITGYYSPYFGAAAGIEYQYNQYLQTHAQPPANFSQLLFNKPPAEPDDVTLTVDPALQAAATNALQSAPLANRDGAIVVLQPSTGAVLALASNPSYDPNQLAPNDSAAVAYKKAASVPDAEGFTGLDPIATQVSFAPGSTFKVITSTAVYNLKPSLSNYSFPSASSVIFPDSGGIPLKNDGGAACGGTMTLMLPQSCDPGYGALGVQLGVPTLTKQAQDFGYAVGGSKSPYVPDLDLPDVAPSTFSALLPDAQAYLADSAIGQYNDSSTPLEGALVAAGIANGGVIMTPHLMEKVTDSQGAVVTTYTPTPMLTAATPAAAAAVTNLMISVANDTVPGATANGIFPVSWHVAVKTGTAQAPNVVDGVRVEQTDDWMIGFMPAVGTPQIAIAVVVPEQSFTGTGAGEAGPIVKKVFAAYLAETGAQG
jgi:peptidoglycan glycosyltransferase